MENVENDDNWQGDTDFKPEEEVFDDKNKLRKQRGR